MAEPETLSGLIVAPFIEAAQLTSDILTSPKTHKAVVRFIVLGGIIATAIIGAIVGYLTFYWLFIPELGLSERVFLHYGLSRPPFARVDLLPIGDYLATDQAYDVSLELSVPNTPNNLALGNFMVTADFRAADDTSVYTVSRPGAVSYTPATIRAMQAFSDVRTLLGVQYSQSQRIYVSLVERRTLQRWSQANKISHVIVTVGRADAHIEKQYQGGLGELQVYESTIHFDAHFSGLRYVMYHYRFLSFLLFTSMFIIFEIVTALGAWAFVSYRRGSISPYANPEATPRPLRPKRPSAYKALERPSLRRRRSQQPVGMDDPSLKEEETEEELGQTASGDDDVDDGDGDDGADDDEAGSWEGIEAVARTVDEGEIKPESEDELADGGSSTSRGAGSSLGSFPATASSATTASSTQPQRPSLLRQASVEEGSSTSQEDEE